MEPVILGTLIMMVFGLLPDYGIWRTDNTFNRFSTATAVILGVNHVLDPQPLYFLSQLDRGATQYDMYLAAFQKENLDHLEDVTVEYRPALNSTPIGTATQEDGTSFDTTATDNPLDTPEPSFVDAWSKFLPLYIAFIVFFITKYFMQKHNHQQDSKLAALYRQLGNVKDELAITQENLVIAGLKATFHSITSVNRLAITFLLRLKIKTLKRKLDALSHTNAGFEALIPLLRAEIAKLEGDLAEANKQLSTSTSKTAADAIISSLRAEVEKANAALTKANKQQPSSPSMLATEKTISSLRAEVRRLSGELAKAHQKQSPSTSTTAAVPTPPKLSMNAAVFKPASSSGISSDTASTAPSTAPSTALSAAPLAATPSKIPAPIHQGSAGTIANKFNAPLGPNGKPVRHGRGFGGRADRSQNHNDNGNGASEFAFGPIAYPIDQTPFSFGGYGGPQPGPTTYPTNFNAFGFGANGGSQPGDGSGDVGGFGQPASQPAPGGFQGFGGFGQQ